MKVVERPSRKTRSKSLPQEMKDTMTQLADSPPVTSNVIPLPAPAAPPEPPVLAAPPVVAVPPSPDLYPVSVDPVLVKILSWKRDYDTAAEHAFMSWLHSEIKARGASPVIKEGGGGCIVVDIARPDGKKTGTLFSCHTDTVHYVKPGEVLHQKILYDPSFGHIFLDKDDPGAGNCLGADDGAGVWLMLEMISAQVAGTYVFHRGEERGGKGAYAMLTKQQEWLEQFDCAIAFDRPGTDEVITHQGGLRCASDKFGEALAKALNGHDDVFKYKTSNRGVFTDTKVYRGAISECVNIGVGYAEQHSKSEHLDYDHLVRLRAACIKLDWTALPVDRDPKAVDTFGAYDSAGYQGYRGYDSYGGYPKRSFPATPPYSPVGKKKKKKVEAKVDEPQIEMFPEQEVEGMALDQIADWCESDPTAAAALLVDMASEVAALKAKVQFLKGALK